MKAEADRECGLNDEAKENSREYYSRQKLQTRAHILERSMFPILGIRKGQENQFRWFLKINGEYTQFLFKGGVGGSMTRKKL